MRQAFSENEVNPHLLRAAKKAGLPDQLDQDGDPTPQGVFVDFEQKRYFVARMIDGSVRIVPCRKTLKA